MDKSKDLRCTAWNNGGNGWGIRMGKERHKISRDTTSITVKLAEKTIELPIKDSFWTTCPEIRSTKIREFFFQHGINKENKTNYWVMLHQQKDRVFDVTIKQR
ncbi:MAG: hypothetical protein ACFFFG_17880 [Candidatus Thorarchaeota archaeon]